MAIKKPVKTIDEAFISSCKKNGLLVKKRIKSRKSMNVRDEENNTYTICDDFSFLKKSKKSSLGKKPVEKVDITSLTSPIPKFRRVYGKKKSKATAKATATELI